MERPHYPQSVLASSLAVAVALFGYSTFLAQGAISPEAVASYGSTNWTTQQDHKNMMEQLGIQRLRPGPSGQPGATNAANYDPTKADPYPDLPDPLILKN